MICGPVVFRLPRGVITEEHMHRAYKILGRFEKVMLFDRLKTQLPEFMETIGWESKKKTHANPSAYAEPYIMSVTQRKLIAGFNRWDIILYKMLAGT